MGGLGYRVLRSSFHLASGTLQERPELGVKRQLVKIGLVRAHDPVEGRLDDLQRVAKGRGRTERAEVAHRP